MIGVNKLPSMRNGESIIHYQAIYLSDAGDEYLCDHHHYSVRTALKCANKMSNSRKVGGSVH